MLLPYKYENIGRLHQTFSMSEAKEDDARSAGLKLIPSDGDCFYRAVVEAFLMDEDDVRNYEGVIHVDGDDGTAALRRTAAMAVTEETFNNFKLCQEAELEDYQFMSAIDSVEELRDLIMVSGFQVGSKKCLWANEFEIQAVCDALNICCLILDMDTKDPSTSKHVKVGESRERFIILQRSGEHYSLVYRREENGGKGVQKREHLTKTAFNSWKIDQ